MTQPVQDMQIMIRNEYSLESMRLGHVRLYFHPVDHFYHRNLDSLAQAADYLSVRSELPVIRILKNRSANYTVNFHGTNTVLMAMPLDLHPNPSSIGEALAQFHRETSGVDLRFFPESPMNHRTVEWMHAVDELERKYITLQRKKDLTAFEQLFLNAFPYYFGCAENAIEYLVNLSIDFQGSEVPVLSHYRFAGLRSLYPENPSLWTVDDYSRDLAEWLRLLAWKETSEEIRRDADQFLNDYEKVLPLSDSLIARLFCRLLYPLSFLECCTRFFREAGEDNRYLFEETLRLHLDKTEGFEAILSYLAERYGNRLQIPEWLAN